jgi:hypothetical protein
MTHNMTCYRLSFTCYMLCVMSHLYVFSHIFTYTCILIRVCTYIMCLQSVRILRVFRWSQLLCFSIGDPPTWCINLSTYGIYSASSGLGATKGATEHVFPFWLHHISSTSDRCGPMFEGCVQSLHCSSRNFCHTHVLHGCRTFAN